MADEQNMSGANKGTSKLKSASDLLQRVDTLKSARQRFEKDWALNLAFYRGKQYVRYNPVTRQVYALPTEEGEKPRYRVRLVSNQVVTGAHSLLSKLTKTKPSMFASPGSSDYEDRKAAELSESLLEHWWSTFELSAKLEEALLWSIITGQGYWKIGWDPYAGRKTTFMLNPMGQPIVTDAEKEVFRAELEKYGIPPQEQTVYEGDLKIEVLSPDNVLLDSNAKLFEDAKYAFCRHYMTPEEIETKWGVKVEADSVPSDIDINIPFDNSSNALDKTVKAVWVGYFKPTPQLPQGRYVVFIDTPKQILSDEPWPYPFQELPIVKFPGIRVPGSVYDDAVVTHARPLQIELNRTLSQIVEYKNLMMRPRVWAPIGSVRTKMNTEPGVVQEFIPIQGMRPEPESLPTLPPYVFEHLKDINARLNDVFGLAEVSQGQVPPNVEAGIAIDLLQEMATDRIAPTIKLMELAIGRAGNMMLALAQAYYKEPRTVQVVGSHGVGASRAFSSADIAGNIDVRVEAGSGLPRTRAGRQARVLQLYQAGILPLEKAMKFLDLADIKGIMAPYQADENLASREHEKILRGEPLNPEALQQAIGMIQQGMNPETQEPLSGDMNEIQNLVERASLSPGPADNHSIHMDTHSMFIKSIEFDRLPMDVRQRFLLHFELTQQRIPIQQGENDPKVNLNIRSAAGPSMLAEILKRTGVEVPPEVIAQEPPTETWVTDSIDKPDVDITSAEAMQNQQLAALESQMKMEMHDAQLRKAEADADKAEKEAKQPPKKE